MTNTAIRFVHTNQQVQHTSMIPWVPTFCIPQTVPSFIPGTGVPNSPVPNPCRVRLQTYFMIYRQVQSENLSPYLKQLSESAKLISIMQEDHAPSDRKPRVVHIFGTCHTSHESGIEVDRLIQEIRPDCVVVELCKSRVGLMYTQDEDNQKELEHIQILHQKRRNPFQLGGSNKAGFVASLSRSLKLGGRTAFLLQGSLAAIASRFNQDQNRIYGNDFKAAARAAEKVGSVIVLGDRPIEITLARSWNALPLHQKFQLLLELIQASLRKRDHHFDRSIENFDSDDVDDFLKNCALKFPALYVPLIEERDLYLTWSLTRSKAVREADVVVGIVGRGHLPGIKQSLENIRNKTETRRFRDLVKRPSGVKTIATIAILAILEPLFYLFIYELIFDRNFQQASLVLSKIKDILVP